MLFRLSRHRGHRRRGLLRYRVDQAGLRAAAPWILAVLIGVVYVGLIMFGARYPELELDDPNSPVVSLPETGPTVKSGLHFILPVVVLVWCLMVERLSPGLSAFWATALMMFILVTQRPLVAMFRKQSTSPQSPARLP